MTAGLYIAAIGPESSKSTVTLGLMETLAGKAAARRLLPPDRVEPATGPDPQIELIRRALPA